MESNSDIRRIRDLEEENKQLRLLLDKTDNSHLSSFLRYRTFFHNLNEAFFVLGINENNSFTNFYEVNQKACSDLDYTPYELLSLSFEQITSPAYLDKIPDIILTLNTEGHIHFETVLMRKDKTEFYCEIFAHLIYENNNPVIYAISHDISERKKVETAYKISENRFQSMASNISEGLTISLGYKTIFVNKALTVITGYPAEELMEMSEFQIAAPEEKARLDQLFFTNPEKGKQIKSVEYSIVCKNGARKYIQNNYSWSTGTDSEEMRFIVTTDITRRRETEKALIESEENFRQLSENIHAAFFLHNIDGNQIYINSQASGIWGRPIEELSGDIASYIKWIFPDDREKFKLSIQSEEFIRFKRMNLHYRIIRPNSEIRWIWARTFPIYNDHNEIYRIAGICIDITDQKNLENQLLKAKEKAEEADKIKTRFLANVSHQIRTPLNSIIGFSDLLKDSSLDDKSREEYVTHIHENSNQLIRLIDEIIDISKIESGKISFNVSRVSINEIITSIHRLYNEKIEVQGKTGLKIINNGPSGDVFIDVDPERLFQVLTNLMNNAMQFTQEGFIEIGCKVSEHQLEIFVKDTGIGIPSDKLNEIFEPFTQLNKQVSPSGSSGLGLAVTKSLIEKMGGFIWVESEPGKGSVFTFTLPLGKKPQPKAAEIQPEQAISAHRATILVVEDDDTNFMLIREALRKSGLEILWAKNGKEAVDIATSNHKISLILMDIQLPIMNGYEATKEIKKVKPKLPVIAQTAYAMYNDVVQSLDAGCDDFLAKPIKIKKLQALIDKYLQTETEQV